MADYPFYHSHIEVSREVLQSNARYLHRNLKSGTRSVAVIKADAYGHGAVEVARAVGDLYDMFAVANVTEAVVLRKGGVTKPILVFGVPVPQTVRAYPDYDLEAVVSEDGHFDLLDQGTAYHVKIDTGMGRLGIRPDDLDRVLRRIESAGRITCKGIMTHFASADEGDCAKMQEQKRLLVQVREVFGGRFPLHAANSAASLAHPDTHLDMVRHGIALYGYDPTPEPSDQLRPAMKWRSWVAQCKYIHKGDSLSYGATWQAPEEGYYAVVPTGYADGYRRGLSGKMPVRIEDRWYPQVGRVTMDYVMVWLGGDRYDAGTAVLVMGGERNHAGLWAEAIGTIPYEICCGIHTKVPRRMV
jgi:alanine racemase